MTRTIPPSMGGVLEELELNRPTLVTSSELQQILDQQGVATPAKVVASRLRDRGWLLPTGTRGVWEFVPAAVAGAYSRNDPVMPFQAFLATHPDARCALTFQAAAWAHGIADRVPVRLEVAAATRELGNQLPATLGATVFDPVLNYAQLRGVPVLAVESIVVHMAARPADVRSWASVEEWLPGLASRLSTDLVLEELADRPRSVWIRTGYLIEALRPGVSDAVRSGIPITGKTWFGPRGKLRRHDAYWQVADTVIPFDPRTMRSVE